MNNKDDRLIYEAYLAERVTKLSDAHLADIHAKFYPEDDEVSFKYEIAPAVEDSFDRWIDNNDIDPGTYELTATQPVDVDGLYNHLLELKYGKLGALTRRGLNFAQKKGKKLKRAVDKERKRWTIQSPIKRSKYPGWGG